MKRSPTAGIVLAAGMSTRLGKAGIPKQLLEAGGKPLLAWTIEAALRSELRQVVLVLGHEAERVLAALGTLGSHPLLKTVVNERYREGMAGSLQAGLREVKDEFPSVMFLLGDQPLAGTAFINLLLHDFWKAEKGICFPVCGGRQGNPVIFSNRFYDDILGITGDKGAREIISAHPQQVLSVEINDPRCFLDVDSAEDLEIVLPCLVKGS